MSFNPHEEELNLKIKTHLPWTTGITKDLLKSLINRMINVNNQGYFEVCWACSAASSIRTSILEEYKVNISVDYILKFILFKMIENMLQTVDLNNVTGQMLSGNHSKVVALCSHLPFYDSRIGNRLFKIDYVPIVSEQIAKNEVLFGLHPMVELSPPDYYVSHSMTLIGFSRNGSMKLANSQGSIVDLIEVPYPSSKDSFIGKFTTNGPTGFSSMEISAVFGAQNDSKEYRDACDRMDKIKSLNTEDDDKSVSSESKIKTKKYDFSIKNSIVDGTKLDMSGHHSLTELSINMNEDWVDRFSTELFERIPIRNDLNDKQFIKGHWRYRWGMKPRSVDE